MVHIALLRGINVGGRSAVDMRALKATFERLGFAGVRTYINSGNVVFSASTGRQTTLAKRIEAGIVEDFGLDVAVLVLTTGELSAVADAVPAAWVNDATMKCDVFFLWPDIDNPSIVDDVPRNPAIEDLLYAPRALVRRIDKKDATRSPMHRVLGTDLYRRMTVRNINTVRKLRELSAGG